MSHSLLITPSGSIALGDTDESAGLSSTHKPVLRAFQSSQACGLFALAASAETSMPASFVFWREFARQYLKELCHAPLTPEGQVEPISPPSLARLSEIVLSAPPMVGAEYLTIETLKTIWLDLDSWTRAEIAQTPEGLAGFLAEHAPLWRQVGRVCFHLAENKRDPEFPFAFLATYIPGVSKGDRAHHQPLNRALNEYAGARNKEALIRLLSPVHQASEKSEFVRNLVDSGDLFHPLAWTPREAHRFLKETSLYEESGLLVRLPDWWRQRPRPRVGAVIGNKSRTSLGMDALLDFNVQISVGDESMSEKELQQLLEGDEGLVLLKGRWVEVDREKLSHALEHWKKVEQASKDGSLSFIDGMRLLAGAPATVADDDDLNQQEQEWSFVRAGDWLGQVLAQARSPGQETHPGKELRATLRPYQAVGVDWLWLMTNLGLGACLADDMGLGKTIQVLSLFLVHKQKGKKPSPSLLVLPASLLANWKAELSRFTPSLKAAFVHPSEQTGEREGNPESAAHLNGTDVVLTTYGMLQRKKWLLEVDWHLVVLDEAQAIKNPSTRQTRTVKALKAKARIALTGTPVENRLSDLWSLFDFLCPGLLGSALKFKQFVKALDQRPTERYTPLRNLVQPYILRRLKTDKTIVSDLPDKTEVKAFCGLTKRQAALYQRSVVEMTEAMSGQDGMKRRGIVLAYLMRFKQICNHPSQLVEDGVFDPEASGKFSRLTEICEELAARQEKALVFTQFRAMTEPIATLLSGVFGRQGLVLHGGTPVGRRQQLVDQFQRQDGPPFFVLSLKAGGTGLNLTAASHVIHFDRWWNPAVENQATDRAFRIGQHRNVLVHKFVCRGTVEERIDQLIDEKKSLADHLLKGGAEQMLTEMTDEQLIAMVSLDVDKAM